MQTKNDALIQWLSKSDDFYLSDKIEIKDIPNAGRGVVLTNGEIKKNEVIISIPGSHQINFHNVLYHISKFNPNIHVNNVTYNRNEEENTLSYDDKDPRYNLYGIFTTEFLLELNSFQLLSLYIIAEWCILPQYGNNGISSFWKPFFDVWPTEEELKSIPALWNCSKQSKYKKLLSFLSESSLSHMRKVCNLIETDWNKIEPVLIQWLNLQLSETLQIESLYEKFLHIYFIINSRCLYAEIPLKHHDTSSKFTLVPYVDFLNHADEMDIYCYPKMDNYEHPGSSIGQFVIRGGSYTYKIQNEQILFNYGPHSNDSLLNEYGFTLTKNKWNYINISKVIKDLIGTDETMVKYLKDTDYWGDYTINYEDISYRTFVALSLYVTKDYKRIDKLMLGYISEDFFNNKIKKFTLELLQKLLYEIKEQKSCLLENNENDTTEFCIANMSNIYDGYIIILAKNIEQRSAS